MAVSAAATAGYLQCCWCSHRRRFNAECITARSIVDGWRVVVVRRRRDDDDDRERVEEEEKVV